MIKCINKVNGYVPIIFEDIQNPYKHKKLLIQNNGVYSRSVSDRFNFDIIMRNAIAITNITCVNSYVGKGIWKFINTFMGGVMVCFNPYKTIQEIKDYYVLYTPDTIKGTYLAKLKKEMNLYGMSSRKHLIEISVETFNSFITDISLDIEDYSKEKQNHIFNSFLQSKHEDLEAVKNTNEFIPVFV